MAESASDNAQAGGTVDVAVDSNKVAATESSAADELGGKLVPEAGSEVDPIQSWDAPQSLPAPSDDKAVGSMLPSDVGSEGRSTSGKSTSKQHQSSAAGKHHTPGSARSATSAAGGAKKGASTRAVTPFYADLAYVPTYAMDGCEAEFFHRIRARYYIVPGSSADPHCDDTIFWEF